MDRRYIFLVAALICFAFTSFSSTSQLRGVWAPVLGVIFLCVCAYYLVVARVEGVSRPESYIPSPEENELLKRQREKTLRK
jgi:Ca2+/Na+ antiporter